jgi:hypothetical protein
MICDILYCPAGKRREIGAPNKFGVLCENHDKLWKKMLSDHHISAGSHKSVERRLYVQFKVKYESEAIKAVPKQKDFS